MHRGGPTFRSTHDAAAGVHPRAWLAATSALAGCRGGAAGRLLERPQAQLGALGVERLYLRVRGVRCPSLRSQQAGVSAGAPRFPLVQSASRSSRRKCNSEVSRGPPAPPAPPSGVRGGRAVGTRHGCGECCGVCAWPAITVMRCRRGCDAVGRDAAVARPHPSSKYHRLQVVRR
jgi:hypothetical protein